MRPRSFPTNLRLREAFQHPQARLGAEGRVKDARAIGAHAEADAGSQVAARGELAAHGVADGFHLTGGDGQRKQILVVALGTDAVERFAVFGEVRCWVAILPRSRLSLPSGEIRAQVPGALG